MTFFRIVYEIDICTQIKIEMTMCVKLNMKNRSITGYRG